MSFTEVRSRAILLVLNKSLLRCTTRTQVTSHAGGATLNDHNSNSNRSQFRQSYFLSVRRSYTITKARMYKNQVTVIKNIIESFEANMTEVRTEDT